MVLTLYLIRHAKSSWKDESLDDRERPLAKRGKREVKAVARHLRQQGVQLDAVLSSPAKRARATCRKVCKAVGFDRRNVAVKKSLYFEGKKRVLRNVQRLQPECRTAAVFGHNPDWTDCVLACRDRPPDFAELPTCGVAVIQFACDSWSEASWSNASCISVLTPKDIEF